MNKKPNIVFILNDHQAFYRHGWDGGVKPLRPNFEKLATEGIEFTNAYCATPLCAPVRRTILNGQFPHKHQNWYNTSTAPYNEDTYLKCLHEDAGYNNFYFGKWHAGANNPITIPSQYCEGFSQDGYGNPYTSKEYYDYLKRYNLPEAEHLIDWHCVSDRLFAEGHFPNIEVGKKYKCDSSWCGEHATGVTVTPKETHESFFLATLACEQLEKSAKSPDEPFNIRLDFWGPHQPFFPTQEFLDMYNPNEIQPYGNFDDDLVGRADVHRVEDNRYIATDDQRIIYPNPLAWEQWQKILAAAYAHSTMIDAAAGMVLDKLKELGLDDNTVVIWGTDHGDALASHGGHFDKCSYMSQEVMRIPLTMKWKNVVEPNQKCDKLVSNMDIPVTIMDACGLKFNQEVHGESFLPLAKNSEASWREDLMCETGGHGYVERLQGRMLVHKNHKLVLFENQIDELYDLDLDPYELNNLAYNSDYGNIKQDLLSRLHKWQAKTNDPVTLQ